MLFAYETFIRFYTLELNITGRGHPASHRTDGIKTQLFCVKSHQEVFGSDCCPVQLLCMLPRPPGAFARGWTQQVPFVQYSTLRAPVTVQYPVPGPRGG